MPLLRVCLDALDCLDVPCPMPHAPRPMPQRALKPENCSPTMSEPPSNPLCEPSSNPLARVTKAQRYFSHHLWESTPPLIHRTDFPLDVDGWDFTAIDVLSTSLPPRIRRPWRMPFVTSRNQSYPRHPANTISPIPPEPGSIKQTDAMTDSSFLCYLHCGRPNRLP